MTISHLISTMAASGSLGVTSSPGWERPSRQRQRYRALWCERLMAFRHLQNFRGMVGFTKQ
jgi:hypothetical protein